MKKNNKIGVMLLPCCLVLLPQRKIQKNSYLHNGSTVRNNSNILKKLKFRATTFICDHFDIVYNFQGLEYTFK
jgi:hypothetical protein